MSSIDQTRLSAETRQLVHSFTDMVRISSESGNEFKFLQFMKRFLRAELAAESVLDAYGNLIARVPARKSRQKASVLLCAHADTVSPGQRIEPVLQGTTIVSKGQTILGADDKAGIAEIIEAVRRSKASPPIEILLTRQEEVGFLGAKNLDETLLLSKIGFVVDGLDLSTIITGWPTVMHLDLTITGRPSHPGLDPEKGVSALVVASRAIASLPHGLVAPETTLNIGTFRSGELRNAIPDTAIITAECRSMQHNRCVDLATSVQEAFRREARQARAEISIDTVTASEARTVEPDTHVVEVSRDAIRGAGLNPSIRSTLGGSDASYLNAKGISSVVIGYGGKNVHSLEEEIDIGSMERATAILQNVIQILAKS
jgi:tripeptide aminopeptidase